MTDSRPERRAPGHTKPILRGAEPAKLLPFRNLSVNCAEFPCRQLRERVKLICGERAFSGSHTFLEGGPESGHKLARALIRRVGERRDRFGRGSCGGGQQTGRVAMAIDCRLDDFARLVAEVGAATSASLGDESAKG